MKSATACVHSVQLALEQPITSPSDMHLVVWRVMVKSYKAREAERRRMNG